MTLDRHEEDLLDGALDVAVQLAASENEQHKNLGRIIGGLCAIIHKRTMVHGEIGRQSDG